MIRRQFSPVTTVFIIACLCASQVAAKDNLPKPPVPPTAANVHYGPGERQVLDFWQAKSDKPASDKKTADTKPTDKKSGTAKTADKKNPDAKPGPKKDAEKKPKAGQPAAKPGDGTKKQSSAAQPKQQ